MKSNFNTSKWFKNQYLYEGMSDEEIQTIKRYEELTDDDKLKLAKIQAMMDRERALREEDDIEKFDAKADFIDQLKKHKANYDKTKTKPAQVAKEKLPTLYKEDDINEMDAPMHIEKLMDAAEMAYDAGMDVDEILGMIEQHLGLKMGDY